jgi:hypothetical protein
MGEIRVGRLRRDCGISVAEPTLLGNPFALGQDRTRAEIIAEYRLLIAIELRSNGRVQAAIERIFEDARLVRRQALPACY